MDVLFVCLGNICRSPTAHGIMESLGHKHQLDLRVDSAGTADYHQGSSPDERSIGAAKKLGYDLSHLRARQVNNSDFFEFDYILAMDVSNLNYLKALQPENSNAIVELFLPSGGDVPDPYYGGENGFDEVVKLCEQACNHFLEKHTSVGIKK